MPTAVVERRAMLLPRDSKMPLPPPHPPQAAILFAHQGAHVVVSDLDADKAQARAGRAGSGLTPALVALSLRGEAQALLGSARPPALATGS